MVRTTLGFVLFLVASASAAFIPPPTVVPSNATPDQTITVSVLTGSCDFILDGAVVGEDPDISLSNNVVNLTLDGVRAFSPFCTFGTHHPSFSIGTFPPGEYVVNVYYRYTDFFSFLQTELVGSPAFTVTGAVARQAIPSSSPASAMILVLVIALAGMLVARRRA